MENGDYLWLDQDHGQNLKEIARHSKHDADAYEQYSHDMDMVCQALKPLFDQVAARHLQRRPGGAARARGARPAVPPDGQAHPPQRRPAADRQRRRLPRRLLRVRHRQGLPRELEHHRHQGRAALAGLGARAALPLAGRARRRVRGVGVPQEGQRRVHPGARPRGAVVRGGDPPRVAGRLGHHQGRPGDRRRPRRDGTEFYADTVVERARPAPHVPRARQPARAARRPRRDHPAASASRARRRR